MVPVLSATEATSVAGGLAAEFAVDAVRRDAERILPRREIDRLTESGLLAITVPAAHGGAGLGAATVAEVVRLISVADPNIGQIPHSHFVYVNALRHQGTREQRWFFFREVLTGKRFGNAQSEVGTKHVRDIRTTLTPAGNGRWTLSGTKGYSTGALFADWIPVLARQDTLAAPGTGPLHVAWVERQAPGVSVTDDWNGMGQRTTASGTVQLDQVEVTADRITPYHLTFQAAGSCRVWVRALRQWRSRLSESRAERVPDTSKSRLDTSTDTRAEWARTAATARLAVAALSAVRSASAASTARAASRSSASEARTSSSISPSACTTSGSSAARSTPASG